MLQPPFRVPGCSLMSRMLAVARVPSTLSLERGDKNTPMPPAGWWRTASVGSCSTIPVMVTRAASTMRLAFRIACRPAFSGVAAAADPVAPPSSLFVRCMESGTPSLAVRALADEQDPERAWSLFQRVLPRADVHVFESMMEFCQRRMPAKAPEVLDAALSQGAFVPDALFGTFVTCCLAADPPMVREALDLYNKCGIRSDNVMFAVAHLCRVAKQPSLALFLVRDALREGVLTGKLLTMLSACCAESNCKEGADEAARLVHHLKKGKTEPAPDQQVFAHLIAALLSQERVDAAFTVLHLMQSMQVPASQQLLSNVLSATSVQAVDMALKLFWQMKARSIVPSRPAIVALIAACGRARNTSAVGVLYGYVRERKMLLNDIAIQCALIAAYSDCTEIQQAERVFRLKNSAEHRGPAVFNAMITVYGDHDMADKALELFQYVKAADIRWANEIFNTIAAVLSKCDRVPQGLDVFRDMLQRGIEVANETFVGLISASGRCFNLPALNELRDYSRTTRRLMMDDSVVSALITAYSRCGQLQVAEQIFDGTNMNVPVFSAMMTSYCHNDVPEKAIAIFEQLKAAGLTPDENAIASLAKAGLLRSADDLLSSAPSRVDLLCHKGDLDAAEEVALSSPTLDALSTLLNGCRMRNDLPRAERTFDRIRSLKDGVDPDMLAGCYQTMADTYAECGRASDAERIRDEMETKELSTPNGTTTVILAGGPAQFKSDDSRYRFDVALRDAHSSLTKALNVHSTEGSQMFHSEMFALAYALKTVPGSDVINAATNVRMCSDCHQTAKRVSAIYNRDIIIWDRSRRHHLRDGTCTCNDVW